MTDCPCGSGLNYEECCGPFHAGKKTPTAEATMRARYSAFVTKELDYIKTTHNPDRMSDYNDTDIKLWAENSEWMGLKVVNVEGGQESDTEGKIEFVAKYKVKGQMQNHHEVAIFEKRDDTWFFMDGEIESSESIKREGPKVGRNDPCPCGSGKKHKKCCL